MTPTSEALLGRRARQLLLASVAGTLLLYVVPYGGYIGYPLLLLSTLAHETGHGLAAIFVGGDFEWLRMWPDGAGVAFWSGRVGRVGQAWIAAGGLIGPAVAAAVGFVLGRDPRWSRGGLWLATVALVVLEVWVVRNLFGFAFVALLAVMLGVLAARATPAVAQGVIVFLSVQLALSVYSRGDYLFTASVQTNMGPMPSDVTQMARALWLPYWFWGGLCGLISLAVVGLGLWSLMRSR